MGLATDRQLIGNTAAEKRGKPDLKEPAGANKLQQNSVPSMKTPVRHCNESGGAFRRREMEETRDFAIFSCNFSIF
jgi:hypothetical protein